MIVYSASKFALEALHRGSTARSQAVQYSRLARGARLPQDDDDPPEGRDESHCRLRPLPTTGSPGHSGSGREGTRPGACRWDLARDRVQQFAEAALPDWTAGEVGHSLAAIPACGNVRARREADVPAGQDSIMRWQRFSQPVARPFRAAQAGLKPCATKWHLAMLAIMPWAYPPPCTAGRCPRTNDRSEIRAPARAMRRRPPATC